MQASFQKTLSYIRHNKFNPKLMRSFDWPVLVLVLVISLFGVLCIFCATAVPADTVPANAVEALNTQPTYYARLQLVWILAGLIAMGAIIYFDYDLYARASNVIYWANIALLVFVLFTERLRGGMAGWFKWGIDASRTMQPSEFGKLAIIISLAKLFSQRQKPVTTVSELIPILAYVGLPLGLIAAQPDFGTALVYIVIFGVMLFTSGTSYKLIIGMLSIGILLLVPLWYIMTTTDNFRAQRIMVFLDPESNPDAAMQMTNARMALGSAGVWGKGMFSVGSIASLNYIPDDHTDFIFAVVGETFGFAGAGLLVAAFALLLVRLLVLSSQAADAFGNYVIIGIMSMYLFHIVENVGMVIGLLPVTGIPLPFISYGGSNMLTNMIGLGLVLNISMRSRERRHANRQRRAARL